MSRAILKLCLILLATAFVAACGGGAHEDPLLRLSAEEALEQGKALMEAGKYVRAAPFLTHAFEVEPNSRDGREALLLAADSLFLAGKATENYIKCEAKYRDFLNRFPTSERADYAQFQVANCLAARTEKPDRDQKITLEARAAYEELMRLYPSSPYAAEARAKIVDVNNLLAAHEMVVGDFYLRYRNCAGSIQRLEYLLENYPEYNALDQGYFVLGLSYDSCNRRDDADQAFEDLRQKYPDSPYVYQIDDRREKIIKKTEKQLAKARKQRDKRFKPRNPDDELEAAADDAVSDEPADDAPVDDEPEGDDEEGDGP